MQLAMKDEWPVRRFHEIIDMSEPSYRTPQVRTPVGAAIVVDRGGDIVLIERKGSHGAGTWGLPGGWVEQGEDPASAAAREAWEEIGITVSSVTFLDYTFDQHPEGFSQVTLWFRASGWSGNIRNTNPDRIEQLIFWPKKSLRKGVYPGQLFEPLRAGIEKGIFD